MAIVASLASAGVAQAATTKAAVHTAANSSFQVAAVEDIRGVVVSVNRSGGTFVLQPNGTNAVLPGTITVTTTSSTVYDAFNNIAPLTNQLVPGARVSVSVVLLVPSGGDLRGTVGGVPGGPGIINGATGVTSSPIGDIGGGLGNGLIRAIAIFTT